MKDNNLVFMDGAVGKLLDQLDGAREKGPFITGEPSGFEHLDDITSGLQRGELIVVGGRVSMGKTALALNIARNISVNNNKCVLYFSLEMASEQLINRLMTMESRVDTDHIKKAKLSESEWERLIEGANRIGNAKLIVDDTPGNTVESIRERCLECKEKYSVDLVIVDYLQLITAEKNYDTRQDEISYITRTLKALAKEISVPLVVLSQLSRTVEQREDHRPVLSDLRESAAVEQDADTVIFIYRDDYYNRDSADKNIVEIIVAKQRIGRLGTVYLKWNPRFGLFDNNYGKRPDIAIATEIIDIVCDEFGIDKESLQSKKRNSEIIISRQIIMYLCRENTSMSLEEIGKITGKKDHTSVMSGISKIKNLINCDNEFSEKISRLAASVTNAKYN